MPRGFCFWWKLHTRRKWLFELLQLYSGMLWPLWGVPNFLKWSTSSEIDISVSESLVSEKKYQFRFRKFCRGKKSWFRFQKIWYRFRSKFLYRHSVHIMSFSVRIFPWKRNAMEKKRWQYWQLVRLSWKCSLWFKVVKSMIAKNYKLYLLYFQALQWPR